LQGAFGEQGLDLGLADAPAAHLGTLRRAGGTTIAVSLGSWSVGSVPIV
jgi:hypothetical protein